MANNPALSSLAPYVGRRRRELHDASLFPASDVANRAVEFDWIEEGAAFVMRQQSGDGFACHLDLGGDDGEPDYQVHDADDRGVARRYAMTLIGRDWVMWRIDPAFSQRFEAVIADDTRAIAGSWKKSFDGGDTWEHDFSTAYTRLDSSRSTARLSSAFVILERPCTPLRRASA